MRWERLQLRQMAQETNGPGKRWGHTCNSVKRGRFLYVFGGYGKDNCQTNNVHVFDTVNQIWSQPMIKGTPPTPRDSHSCTTVGDNLFVFGGTDGMKPLNDLHILDTSSHTWISPSVRGEGPDAREGHSAALIGKRLFIFGGSGKSSDDNVEVYYNDLYILNTETFVWKQATTSGNPPSVRDSHTCSSWKNKIIVIGGEDGHDYYLSDVHILDTETLVWKELSTSGQRLPPRAGHSTVSFGKNLFVFGGFTDAQNLYDDLYMLAIDTGIWTKVMAGGDGPSARFSMAGDSLDPLRGGVLAFLGGCNKNLEALDDMYYLHTGLTSIQEERSLDKLSLRKQLKLKCQERNLNSFGHDKALVRMDTNADFRHTMPSYGQPGRENFKLNQMQLHQGKKLFQAKVIESLSNGYAIETSIDGKLLRGILFSNKPVSPPLATHPNSRKRVISEIDDVSNGDYNATKCSKTHDQGTVDQGTVDHAQSDSVDGRDGSSNEPKTEDVVAPVLESIAPDASQTKEVPADQEASLAPALNLNDDMTEDTPNTDFTLDKENPTMAEGLMTAASSQDGRMETTQEYNGLEK